MKHIFLILSLVFVQNICAQRNTAEDKAKLMITTFFDGFHQGDVAKMQSVMAPDIIMQRTFTDNNGVNRVATSSVESLLEAVQNRPTSQKWDERLLSFKISFDGNLAHVWTPYEFWVNDTFSHCGANSFTLANTENGWKIIHLVDSRRKESCQK